MSSSRKKKARIVPKRKAKVLSDYSSDEEESESCDFQEKSFSETKRTTRSTRAAMTLAVAPIFMTKKDREEAERVRLKQTQTTQKKPKPKPLNPAILAFLHSGVPEAIIKAQKGVEKKKEDDNYLDTVQFFPKFSHNICIGAQDLLSSSSADRSKSNTWPWPILNGGQPNFSCFGLRTTTTKFTGFVEKSGDRSAPIKDLQFCCKKPSSVPSLPPFKNEIDYAGDEDSSSDETPLPWIEKYAVKRKKKLVIDRQSMRKFEGWLSQWKRDIDDDGGMSRKIVQKKRYSDSDAFTTSEEEGEFKKKSVVLCGPTGCGKTALVYVMAKNLGFKVVEVNFSSRRSGKEVMERVEEATLSHRLTDNAEVDESHCLILFKDIDLVLAEEDEGLHSAVAQLITASVRPIVMTTCHPCSLDVKIERKDPLWIYFTYPLPSAIVQRILLPIIKSECEDFEFSDRKLNRLGSVLESVVRHSNCDIRKSINQSQFLCNNRLFSVESIHKNSFPLTDFEHITSEDSVIKSTTESKHDNGISTVEISNAEKLRNIEDLDRISKNLELMTDCSMIPTFRSSEDETEFKTDELRASMQSNLYSLLLNSGGSQRTNSGLNMNDFHRTLLYRNDCDVLNEGKVYKLSEELSAYVDYADDFDAKGYVRSIIKTSVLNSVGRLAKRNGRLSGYFNRLSSDFIQKVCDTFDFQEQLKIAKAADEAENS